MIDKKTKRVLILGGGGMVGLQVAREVARRLEPESIIISGLTQKEVDEAVDLLGREAKEEGWSAEFTPAWGDIFLPESLQGRSRSEMVADRELFDQLFDDIFSSNPNTHRNSALFKLIQRHRPDVIVDCINTATAISYQDVFTTSHKVKILLDRLEDRKTLPDQELSTFVQSIRELLIAQGVPQIVRHILFLHRALSESSVRVFVKVGTTGTGGMGVNIPYTHSEDKPSTTLLSKSAIGFAHTGLLFLLARTPGAVRDERETHGTLIKEVKPGAMIGFKRLGVNHVRLTGADGRRSPGYLLEPREETLGDSVDPRSPFAGYSQMEGRQIPIRIVGADTGENGFFSIGEFMAITYPRQMEAVTPEEVARTVVLEIAGSATGKDVIAAIDGAITEPSYRAGLLREQASREMERLEKAFLESDDDSLPSIAIGHLGPPRLSKLLIESFLLRESIGSTDFADFTAATPEEMQKRVEHWLKLHPRITSLITTIGIPLLREKDGQTTITRGPRLNIPVPAPGGSPIPIDREAVDKYAHSGWVDLRLENFRIWRERLRKVAGSRPNIADFGSAAFDRSKYIADDFRPGDIVGWLLNNEIDADGMVGHRVL